MSLPGARRRVVAWCLAGLSLAVWVVGVAGCWRAVEGVDAGDARFDPCADPRDVAPGADCGCAVPTAVSAPRPIAPMSTSIVTARRPTLRWELSPGTDGAVVDLCRTRECVGTDRVASVEVSGTSFRPDADLAPGVWFWRLRGRAGVDRGMCPGPTWEFVVGARSAAVSTAYGTVPDVDGDGRADVIVGAPGDVTGVGAIFVYRSARGGLAGTPQTVTGVDPTGRFGAAVASAGDINGDGYADVVAGGNFAAERAGRMMVFLGGPDGLATPAVTSLLGPEGDDGAFGTSVAGIGDLDGDGYGDVIVSAYLAQSAAGRVYIYRGGPQGLRDHPATITPAVNEVAQFGSSVASAGDVNGDGFADIVAGSNFANNHVGYAVVFLGSAAGIRPVPLRLEGSGLPGAEFGGSVACAGDVDGDGYTDVVVGAAHGNAWLFRGSSAGIETRGQELVGIGGLPVAGAGDVDGDGLSDMLFGTLGSTAGTTLVRGTASRSFVATLLAGAGGTRFVGGLAGAGDIDRDGFGDVVLGADGPAGGSVVVLFGSPAGLRPDGTVLSAPGSVASLYGFTMAGVRDTNHDTLPDLMIGAPSAGDLPGRVFLYWGGYLGPSNMPIAIVAPDGASRGFGRSIAGVGDLDGDGYNDVVVGAPGSGATPGRAFVLHGSERGVRAERLEIVNPRDTDATFGTRVAAAGDVDHDGHPDVLVAAPGDASTPARVYLFLGDGTAFRAAALQLAVPSDGTVEFGRSIAGGGDVNGDGFADAVVGAPALPGSTTSGHAYLYLGARTGYQFPPIDVNRGTVMGPTFGTAVAIAGDTDGDRRADVVVGAPGASATAQGTVYLFRGSVTNGVLAPVAVTSGSGQGFGTVVTPGGDVNGDDFADVLVGSANGAWLLAGSPSGLAVLWEFPASVTTPGLGSVVAGLGNMNPGMRDTFDDLLIGSTGRGHVYFGGQTTYRAVTQDLRSPEGVPLEFGAAVARVAPPVRPLRARVRRAAPLHRLVRARASAERR